MTNRRRRGGRVGSGPGSSYWLSGFSLTKGRKSSVRVRQPQHEKLLSHSVSHICVTLSLSKGGRVVFGNLPKRGDLRCPTRDSRFPSGSVSLSRDTLTCRSC